MSKTDGLARRGTLTKTDRPILSVGGFCDKEVRKEMISMPTAQSIREMRRGGSSVTAISRKLGVSRDTVYKYLRRDDFSPRPPDRPRRGSVMDEFRPYIEAYLDEDARNWRKQRHTAKRIYERLRDERGCTASESTVRHYVAGVRRERSGRAGQFLTLVWAPGEAQVDFGEADFYLGGLRVRLLYLVVSFPFSNVGIAQVFRGQNAVFVSSSGFQLRKRFFSHVAKKSFRFGKGVPLSDFAS